MLFELHSDSNKKIDLASIESPIQQHIRQIDENLKHRFRNEQKIKIKKSKSEIEKQTKRMNFMGIPTSNADATRCALKSIVERVSSNGKLTTKERVITTKDGGVKFAPKIPSFKADEDECQETKAIPRFVKAQPRGNDPRMLRVDKSLPWIQSEIDVVKRSEKRENHEEREFPPFFATIEETHTAKKASDENRSAIKETFHEIIASKLQNQKADRTAIDSESEDIDEQENRGEDNKVQSVDSTSTLSSNGTFFSNDSGSYFMILDKKIPKSELNIAKKFQVRRKY